MILNIITFLILLPLVLSYFGSMHPFFDAFSHFRLYLLGAAILWFALRAVFGKKDHRAFWWILAVLFGIYLVWMMRPFSIGNHKTVSKTFRHLQYNINLNNTKGLKSIRDFILKNHIDIITLQEVSPKQKPFFQKLAKDGYRWQAYCMRKTTNEAVISRYPFIEGSVDCKKHSGMVSARIKMDDTNLTVVSIHLFLPFPYGQTKQAISLKNRLKSLKKPILIAGDFNAAPWSHTVDIVAKASQTKVVPGLRLSIPTDNRLKPYVPLPIDQVLISQMLSVKQISVAPDMGSDHYPIVDMIGY